MGDEDDYCRPKAEDWRGGKPVQLVKVGGDACTKWRPCGAYHGDCDSDDECAGDLVCVPDKKTGKLRGGEDYDFCRPKAEDWRENAGDNVQLVKVGGEGCSRSKPCGAYHGDCDSDSECAGDLVCVPDKKTGRLSGGGQYDYCRPKAQDWRARRIEESEEALEEGHTVDI